MAERVLLMLAIVALVTLAVIMVRAWANARRRALMTRPGEELLGALGEAQDGRSTVVTFSTPSCAACHTAQAPAVQEVERQVGTDRVRVMSIDAAHQPEVARAFGVLTVPSSVVLDARGKVKAVNHGFAPTQQLLQQIQSA